MKFIFYICRLIFSTFFSYWLYYIIIKFFNPIFEASSLIFPYAVHPFDICSKIPAVWYYIKLIFKFTLFINLFTLIFNFSSFIFPNRKKIKHKKLINKKPKKPYLYVGNNFKDNTPIYINEKGLYQNILVTGTIGSGKTSSAMYPFCKQLIKYSNNNIFDKIGMLILDVKGNFYKQVLKYAQDTNRINDVIVIELNGSYKYNPLHKPNLSPPVLANRLKTILLLFSPNNSESYWIDECEKVLAESIKLCRLYNNGYVTFKEIHKIITGENYYLQKINYLKQLFRTGTLSKNEIYNLHSALLFFENEFKKLDPRTLSILKSEITRITNVFISNYDVLNTFCPEQNELNFLGFKEVINRGKIVVLNMNIAEHENLSKIIAAYLKLDFQSEVLSQLSNNSQIKTTAFICDEYHEYVTLTDSYGVGKLKNNFMVGTYSVLIENPATGQNVTKTMTIVDRIVENNDVTLDYSYSSIFKVRVYGDNGNPVGSGEIVKFKINNKEYSAKTDSNGYASLLIKDLTPKTYSITTEYKGVSVHNTVIVKQILKAKNKNFKRFKVKKYSATLKTSTGKAIKGKIIKFKIKGKTYKAKTNKKGIATIKIKNLTKLGKYKITISYLKTSIKKTIKIKR